jgi:hypothetical protein
VAATEHALAELLARDLSGLDPIALMVDGVHVPEHTCVVALGITLDGTRVPLGLAEAPPRFHGERDILRPCPASLLQATVMQRGHAGGDGVPERDSTKGMACTTTALAAVETDGYDLLLMRSAGKRLAAAGPGRPVTDDDRRDLVRLAEQKRHFQGSPKVEASTVTSSSLMSFRSRHDVPVE